VAFRTGKKGTAMKPISSKDQIYSIDSEGFLLDYDRWNEDFAERMAPEVKIPGGLTQKHWKVIRFIRERFKQNRACPLLYETCRANGLTLKDLKALFPTGYLRGACKLAGITYKERFIDYYGEKGAEFRGEGLRPESEEKVYHVNVRGFLMDPAQWDQNFAIHKAHEMKMREGLSDEHWKIIHFLREYFKQNGLVPSVYETCEANQIELDKLERLFPDGYHRGAVKIAGLQAR
jgi:TusE/DsrC/DsvC family sulfur relay protein